MLSRSSVYALQATLHLAQQPDGAAVSAAAMAERLELPAEYLAKVLRRLAVEGILTSTRGARGGYRLTAPAEQRTVAEVVEAFEVIEPPRVCLLGGPCHSDRPCTAHLRRLEWNAARRRILENTTLLDLLTDESTEGPGRTSRLISLES
jgi:Rrf2 family protein